MKIYVELGRITKDGFLRGPVDKGIVRLVDTSPAHAHEAAIQEAKDRGFSAFRIVGGSSYVAAEPLTDPEPIK